ncbi:MAG: ribonuclease P protein component [Mollicutes bacterium]|nr:ribonuclease P protein component [Mollicutes bacterium]
MKKKDRIKSSIEFNKIIKIGKKISNAFYAIFYIEKEEENPKFGIGVSKKFKKAVLRNKVKRQMREIIFKTKNLFPKNKNYIIIVKEEFTKISFDEKLNNFKKVIGEIHEK